MNDDLHKPVSGKADSIENQEKYLIKKKKAVVQTLGVLIKNKCLISANFAAGRNPLLTLMLEILKDKNLVILDYGPNESVNRQILDAKQINFLAQHEGIKAKFSAKRVFKAKFKGQPVFAFPIPESMYWFQRREFYRVKVPLNEPVRCQLSLGDDKIVDYPVLDIGVGGVALMDSDFNFTEEKGGVGSRIESCRLLFPESGEATVTLEVRNQVLLNKSNRREGQRVGCAFKDISYAIDSKIQHYMQMIDLQRRRVATD